MSFAAIKGELTTIRKLAESGNKSIITYRYGVRRFVEVPEGEKEKTTNFLFLGR